MLRFFALSVLVACSFTAVAQSSTGGATPVHNLPRTEAASAAAADPAKEAKVRELFAAMHMDRTMDQLMNMVKVNVKRIAETAPGQESMTPAQKKLGEEYQQKTLQLAIDNVGWKAMEPEYVKLYAANFTMEELNAMLAFYTSPAGQTMLNKTPELTQQTMGIVQQRMATLQPQIQQITEDFVTKMKAAAPATPAAKAPPSGGGK